MILIKLYSELQENPRNKVVYRKIQEYFESIKMLNESKAFEELIERKFNANSTDINKE